MITKKYKMCTHHPNHRFNIYGLSPMSIHGTRMPSLRNYSAWVMLDPTALENLDTINLNNLGIDILHGNFPDFNVPKIHQMDRVMDFIEQYECNTKPILVTCIGAHGRTGIVLSIQAGLNGEQNPIEYVRNIYCSKAVETPQQEEFIYEYLDLPVPDDVYIRMHEFDEYLEAIKFIQQDDAQYDYMNPLLYK